MKYVGVWIVASLLVIYHVNGRPHPETDCIPAPYAAWSLVRHASLDVKAYPDLKNDLGGPIRETVNGEWVSRYPVGSTLAMVPIVAPVASFREQPLSILGMQVLGKLSGSLSVAFATLFIFRICSQLAPSARWYATILFGLGTCLASVASQASWMHGPATFWLTLALWMLIKSDDRSWLTDVAIGLCLGMATITRPTAAFFAIATGGTLLAQREWRSTFWVTVGGTLPVLFLAFLNQHYFGNPLLGGYAGEYNLPGPPFWIGFWGQLIAPSRGILVYSPALLFVPFGLLAVLRGNSHRLLLLGWSTAALATLLYYVRWHDWRGGWCFGPRFLTETLPILCVLVGLGIEPYQKRWQRGIAGFLVGLSVLVHSIGMLGYGPEYTEWHRRHDKPDHGECLFELTDTQIEAHVREIQKRLGLRI